MLASPVKPPRRDSSASQPNAIAKPTNPCFSWRREEIEQLQFLDIRIMSDPIDLSSSVTPKLTLHSFQDAYLFHPLPAHCHCFRSSSILKWTGHWVISQIPMNQSTQINNILALKMSWVIQQGDHSRLSKVLSDSLISNGQHADTWMHLHIPTIAMELPENGHTEIILRCIQDSDFGREFWQTSLTSSRRCQPRFWVIISLRLSSSVLALGLAMRIPRVR